MSARDGFSVFLRSLDAQDISFYVLDDGRHVLAITSDISLYVRPTEDDLPAVIDGLRKLADTATQMAGALEDRQPGHADDEPAPEPDPGPGLPGDYWRRRSTGGAS